MARQRAGSERERLIRSLGLGATILNFRLAVRCRRCRSGRGRCRRSRRKRSAGVVDLQIARTRGRCAGEVLRPDAATRFINLLEVVRRLEDDARRRRRHRSASAASTSNSRFRCSTSARSASARPSKPTWQAVNRLIAKAVNVRSEARDAYRVYRAAYDIAVHYQREVLPLRKIISDETLLRYNAMQIDVFALLAEARQRIAATTAAIEAQRDFWLANTNLFVAVVGRRSGRRSPANQSSTAVAADRRRRRPLVSHGDRSCSLAEVFSVRPRCSPAPAR